LTKCGFNLFLREVTWIPASENNLSDGTDVAGIDKYFCANFDKLGYELQFAFHQIKGSLFSCINNSFICKYCSNSFELVLNSWLKVEERCEKKDDIKDVESTSNELWVSSDDKFTISSISFLILLCIISRVF